MLKSAKRVLGHGIHTEERGNEGDKPAAASPAGNWGLLRACSLGNRAGGGNHRCCLALAFLLCSCPSLNHPCSVRHHGGGRVGGFKNFLPQATI